MVLICYYCDKVIEVGTVCSACPICDIATYCSHECLNNDIDKHKEVCGNLTTADGECYSCGKSGIKLKKCGACKITRYCNRECQKVDWPNHKKICQKNHHDDVIAPARRLSKLNFGVIGSIIIDYISIFPKKYDIRNKPVALFKILNDSFFDDCIHMSDPNLGITCTNSEDISIIPLTLDEFKRSECRNGTLPEDYDPKQHYLICVKYMDSKVVTTLPFDGIERLIKKRKYQ